MIALWGTCVRRRCLASLGDGREAQWRWCRVCVVRQSRVFWSVLCGRRRGQLFEAVIRSRWIGALFGGVVRLMLFTLASGVRGVFGGAIGSPGFPQTIVGAEEWLSCASVYAVVSAAVYRAGAQYGGGSRFELVRGTSRRLCDFQITHYLFPFFFFPFCFFFFM